MKAQDVIKNAESIVIKIGTALLVEQDRGGIRQAWIDAFAGDVEALIHNGKKVLIVSSGAVAMGRTALNISLDAAPSSISLEKKQAASAVGQFHMFNGYFKAFSALGITLAQVLLTMSETENRRMHLNARATLNELMSQGVVPIVNENDTISTGELRFGDNDRLAARVAQMIEAETVLVLSTIDGLYTAHPGKDDHAEHIPVIQKIDARHQAMAGDAIPGLSTGGMKSKVEAAIAANAVGIDFIIADGRQDHCLSDIINKESTRTSVFLGSKDGKNARKRWIIAHLSPKGRILIDKGAEQALEKGKSLLPVGAIRAEGDFSRGDVVEICNEIGEKLGMGIAAYGLEDTKNIMGKHSDDVESILGFSGRAELIHRNDMVLQGKL